MYLFFKQTYILKIHFKWVKIYNYVSSLNNNFVSLFSKADGNS